MFIKNYNDAKFYIRIAKQEYEAKKQAYEQAQKECEEAVTALDEQKVKIWASFSKFIDVYSMIKNMPPRLEGVVGRESIDLSIEDLDDIKLNVSLAADIIGNVASSAMSGAAAGAATLSTAAMIGAVATMGLTWVGVPGGFAAATSMASCWMACYGLTVSPLAVIAVPAMIVGGIFLESSSKKKADEAFKILDSARKACQKFDEAEDFVRTVFERCEDIHTEISDLHAFYLSKVNMLQKIVAVKTDYTQFSRDEQYLLASTIILVKLLKNIMVLKLIETKSNNNVPALSPATPPAKESKKDPRLKAEKQKELVDLLKAIAETRGQPGTIPFCSVKTAAKTVQTEQKATDEVPVLCPSDSINTKIDAAKVQRLQLFAQEPVNLPAKMQFMPKNQETAIIHKTYVIGSDNNVIDDGARLHILNSKVYFDDTLTVHGKAMFLNCDICVEKELFVSIAISGGRAVFKNCRFCMTAPARYAHILCSCGTLKICNSQIIDAQYHFSTHKYKGDTLNQSFIHAGTRKEKVHVQIFDTQINNGTGSFFHASNNVKAEFSNCVVSNHKGIFATIQSGNNWMNCGTTFSDCSFIDCTVHRKTKNLGNIEYAMENNALIQSKHGYVKFKRTTFENISTYLFGSELFSNAEETTFESCVFKNIHQDKIPRSGSILEPHSLRKLLSFVQNTVIDGCTFEDCEGLETGPVHSMTYGHKPNIVRNCTFVRYSGDMFFGHAMVENCSFEDSDMTVYIEGSNDKGQAYKSVMYACRFISCRTKEDMIRCQSHLGYSGICVSVSDCIFENCTMAYMVDDAIRIGKGKYCDIAEVSGNQRIDPAEDLPNDVCMKIEEVSNKSARSFFVKGTIRMGTIKEGQKVTVCKSTGETHSATVGKIFTSFRMVKEATVGDAVDFPLELEERGKKVAVGDFIKIKM